MGMIITEPIRQGCCEDQVRSCHNSDTNDESELTDTGIINKIRD
jgi:hypothetical protein